MPARPCPTFVAHFTHVDHLATVVMHGLVSDAAAHESGLLTTEVGQLNIKDRRRQQSVPVPPGGTVSDYVPFYFAPRSPMMSSIAHGQVPSYQAGTARLIYLLTTLDHLAALGHHVVLTDRNAAMKVAAYRAFDPADPVDDGFVDWPLMKARYWKNTPDDPQRRERRMAEALVYKKVEWDAITSISVQSEDLALEVNDILAASGVNRPVIVRPDWYF